ncbi:MAG: hypothetical protein IJT58_03315 [Synergistaceae bacterium]|nr:hypothetical protein [Synergistaceae bacterium]
MPRISVKILCALLLSALLLLPVQLRSEAAQKVNGKAIGSIDDIVKSVNGGELSLSKKGLITIRGGINKGGGCTYVDVYTSIFDTNAKASKARKIFTYPNTGDGNIVLTHYYSPNYFAPAVSRKLYNGKRAFLFHNLARNGELKYYFKTLSNKMTSFAVGKTPDELVNSIEISDFGEYTPEKFSGAGPTYAGQVYGTGVMEVKGYEHEIFVVASGTNHPLSDPMEARLEFFALNADDEGKMTQEPLTELTHETPFRERIFYESTLRPVIEGGPYIASLAVGDFDGDKYNNEVALMINSRQSILVFVYRLNFSDGKLELKSMGDPKGINVLSLERNLWSNIWENQPVADMVAGDFDGDSISELAVLFKKPERAENLKEKTCWPGGPIVGNVHCRIHKWNAQKNAFDTTETIKDYYKGTLRSVWHEAFAKTKVSGVIGLRAVAADLNGDGRDEIATILLGYFHRLEGDSDDFHNEFIFIYPHLAVWKFDNNSDSKNPLVPVHDDAHVKGGVNGFSFLNEYGGDDKEFFGTLYELVKGQNNLLEDKPFLEYFYKDVAAPGGFMQTKPIKSTNPIIKGRNPIELGYMIGPRHFAITAGPFTGTFGTFRTVDDIAIAWLDKEGNDCVTIFKTKIKADDKGNKNFDGFEDGKIALKEKFTTNIDGVRGFVAVDLASEGVELGRPVHIRKKSNISYIAALNAIPYHVDTVNKDGTALTEQPVNFTYSDASNGGNMIIEYGQSTTDSTTNTVKQDLSQSVETMFAADPEAKGGSAFSKVKGAIGFASGIATMINGIKLGDLTPEQRKNMVWAPDPSEHSVAMLQGLLDFFTDRVDKINQLTNDTTSTTTIDNNIKATRHDVILYSDTARHIWRYPVMTRPLPMWLAAGPRVDSTQIDEPGTVNGDKELFITFTMSENSALNTATSVSNSLYQPLHEEGNFFSYSPHVADFEGYNEAGLLSGEYTWAFGDAIASAAITFTEAKSNMQHTETKVTPGAFTSTVSFFERLFGGDNIKGAINMPNTDNPKTFTKQYSKTERIGYSLEAAKDLNDRTADHIVKMQPFVAKEGAMSFATAVQLTNNAKLWRSSSLYQQKSDPALYLPWKFLKDTRGFKANTDDETAMEIRGIKFYAPDFAFLTDNRIVNGQNYEIRVPLYNASFKDTGDFTVRLSWIENIKNLSSIPENDKHTIGEVTMSLGGWSNDKNNNKGWAVFNWTPDFKVTKRAYYFYVEVDSRNDIKDEVHEARHSNGKISDYGGNNTGFYQFYAYNSNENLDNVSTSASASDAINLTSLSFTDANGNRINDMASFILAHKDESFVPVTANFNYNGPEAPYSFFAGYILKQSGKQKVPSAGINTIVNLDALNFEDIEDVFALQDVAIFNGSNKITFTISPEDLINDAGNLTADAHLIAFGIKDVTYNEILESEEEFYEGKDPNFELDPIPDDIVSESVTRTYTLTADQITSWIISNVTIKDTAFTFDSGDVESSEYDRDYLDITLEAVSEDKYSPGTYGREVNIIVSSIAGLTPKGEYEITVQKLTDSGEWEIAEVLTFNTSNGSSNGGEEGLEWLGSSSSGCNTGLGLMTLAFLIGGVTAFRKRS